MPSSLKYRLKVLAHTGVLTKEDLSRIYTDNDVINELENIKAEIEEIKMEKPLMSKGFECYGFKDKTPEDIKTEIIEMLDNRIAELKGEPK